MAIPCDYWYKDRPMSHVGMSGWENDVGSFFGGAAVLIGNAILPGLGSGTAALVDAAASDNPGGGGDIFERVRQQIAAASAPEEDGVASASVPASDSVAVGELVGGELASTAAGQGRISIPDFAAWQSWGSTWQINPQTAHLLSLTVMGPYSTKENKYRSRVAVPAIQGYQRARGIAQPIQTHGHMIAVRNPRGGVVPIGALSPEGVWLALTEDSSRELQIPVEDLRALLTRARQTAQTQLGPGGSGIVSVEAPHGQTTIAPAVPSSGGVGTLALLGALGWFLVRGF